MLRASDLYWNGSVSVDFVNVFIDQHTNVNDHLLRQKIPRIIDDIAHRILEIDRLIKAPWRSPEP